MHLVIAKFVIYCYFKYMNIKAVFVIDLKKVLMLHIIIMVLCIVKCNNFKILLIKNREQEICSQFINGKDCHHSFFLGHKVW